MEAIREALTWLGLDSQAWQQLFWTLVLLSLALVFDLLMRQAVRRTVTESSRRYSIIKVANYVVGFIVLILIAIIWTRGGAGVAAYLGIVSAGLAIAFQEPLGNLAAWVFIVVRRPFSVGDRIEIFGHRGDVVDVRIFAFTIVELGNWVDADQSTGRIIHIPNGLLFRHTVANYTQGFNFIWDEMPVTVTFESDWRRAKQLLTDIVQRHSNVAKEHAAEQLQSATQTYLIHYQHLTPIVWTSVADHGVTLTLRYLCEPRRRRGTANDIWESVLDAFAASDDIDFAYPTTRYYDNRQEGKPGAGGGATPD